MDRINVFIEACEQSEVLLEELMIDEETVLNSVRIIVKLCRGPEPVMALTDYLRSEQTDPMLQLMTEDISERCVSCLDMLIQACQELDVQMFESAYGEYMDCLTDELVLSTLKIDRCAVDAVSNAIERYSTTRSKPEVVHNAFPKSTATIPRRTIRGAARPKPKEASTEVVTEKVVQAPQAPQALSEPPVQPVVPLQTRRRRPDQPSTSKNSLIQVAARIALVRSIDAENPIGRFRSTEVLARSELVKTIRATTSYVQCLEYVRSVFPQLEGMHGVIYELATEDMVEYAKRESLRGLSVAILNYESQLRDLMIDSGAGNVARVLAIGQATSSVLDGRHVHQKTTKRYKRQALLHQDVDVVSLNELQETINTCGGGMHVARGLIKDRISHILKHLDNIKTQESVDRYNRNTGQRTRILTNKMHYDKHVSRANIAYNAYLYSIEHHNVIAHLCRRPYVERTINYLDELTELNERQHKLDVWASGVAGKALYHNDYMAMYRTYFKALSAITESLNSETVRICHISNTMLEDTGVNSLHPLVKEYTRGRSKHSKVNTDAIRVENTREGKRYITLNDEPLPDFSTSVARSNELVRYETQHKTTKEITHAVSQVLAAMSTSHSVKGDDLRRISQILLEVSAR